MARPTRTATGMDTAMAITCLFDVVGAGGGVDGGGELVGDVLSVFVMPVVGKEEGVDSVGMELRAKAA